MQLDHVLYPTPAHQPRTRRYDWLIGLLALLLVAAGDGTVLSLTVSGGANFNETITISATVRADGRIQNSNLYFVITAPSGAVVATHSVGVPSLDAGATFSYSWSSNNSGYPDMGTYTVTLCWSPGNAQNCGIASASTSFYSADTLGWALTAALFGLIGWWLLRRRQALFGAAEAGA